MPLKSSVEDTYRVPERPQVGIGAQLDRRGGVAGDEVAELDELERHDRRTRDPEPVVPLEGLPRQAVGDDACVAQTFQPGGLGDVHAMSAVAVEEPLDVCAARAVQAWKVARGQSRGNQ